MTVQTTARRADYDGNGASSQFTVPFYFLDDAHLKVLATTGGVETQLVLGSDYTVSGAGVGTGGSITTTTPPAAGTKITILRNVPLTQLSHYVENDPFPAASHERALDQATMQIQQLQEQVDRSLTLPPSASGVSTTLPTPLASRIIAWNETATGLQSLDPQALATVVSYGTAEADIFTGDGTTTDFTLDRNPGALANLDVSVAGATKLPGVDYTWDGGTTVTFSVAPVNGAAILIRYMQALPQGTTEAADVSFSEAGVGAVPQDVESALRNLATTLEGYGAAGDGVTNDTVAIQAALNSGAKVVYGTPGKTYLVRQSGTVTINTESTRFCLYIPSDVTLDLRGATIKLDDAQNAAGVLMNGVSGARFTRFRIDGNGSTQAKPATGENPALLVYNCSGVEVSHGRVVNSYEYAGRFRKVSGARFYDLRATTCYGDGWAIGVDALVDDHVTDSFIDEIYAEDCRYLAAWSLNGNGTIFTAKRCQIGRVVNVNCGGGIKIQDSSEDLVVDQFVFIGGGANDSANSGIKIQSGSFYPKRIQVNQIVAKACYGEGLYVYGVYDSWIGSYVGYGNGTNAGGSKRDGFIAGCSGLKIDSYKAIAPAYTGLTLTSLGSIKAHVEIDHVYVHNATGKAVAVTDSVAGSVYNFGSVRVVDDRGGGAATTYAFDVTSGGTVLGRADRVSCNLAHSTTQSRVRITPIGSYRIGAILLGDPQGVDSGYLQLTASSTTTVVANGSIWRDYIGGASNYFHPIIEVRPANANGSTNFASVPWRVTVTDGSSGTGFTITHAATGASDTRAVWRVVGWETISAPLS